MSSIQMSHVDLEQGRILHHHHHHHSSVTGSDISLCFSDADDGGSCYSHFYSTNGGGSYDEDCCSYGGASNAADGDGDDDDCSVEIEIESGVPEIKVHLATNNKVESRDCRICHLGLEGDDGNNESGVPIELGCSCKDDLAAAHKNCAEAWFKIKGNRTCEICHTIARNVHSASEDTTETLSDTNNNNNNNISVTVGSAASTTISAPSSSSETRRFWHGHRFLNFLLACMVFAFVISWLFHFNVPSS